MQVAETGLQECMHINSTRGQANNLTHLLRALAPRFSSHTVYGGGELSSSLLLLTISFVLRLLCIAVGILDDVRLGDSDRGR